MKVDLFSYSQTLDGMNLQEQVAYCARVSNPSNQLNHETSERLIHYLIKHAHWSPLEMVSATLEIETTRDIARQIIRHRSFVFQEFSQRYADPTDSLGFVYREARLQDTKNRQNSIEVDPDSLDSIWWAMRQKDHITSCRNLYDAAIKRGIAKEQARVVLPEGNTVSKLYMAGTLRSWVHYVELRSGAETQKEHRQIAHACAEALEPIFPMIKDFVNG